MKAMMQMQKIDIKTLKEVTQGNEIQAAND